MHCFLDDARPPAFVYYYYYYSRTAETEPPPPAASGRSLVPLTPMRNALAKALNSNERPLYATGRIYYSAYIYTLYVGVGVWACITSAAAAG